MKNRRTKQEICKDFERALNRMYELIVLSEKHIKTIKKELSKKIKKLNSRKAKFQELKRFFRSRSKCGKIFKYRKFYE